MWLMPCSRSSSSVRSASALETSPSAAAPKITRLDSCPVAPKGARSIMRRRLLLRESAGRREHLAETDHHVRRLTHALNLPAGLAEEMVAPCVVAPDRGATVTGAVELDHQLAVRPVEVDLLAEEFGIHERAWEAVPVEEGDGGDLTAALG